MQVHVKTPRIRVDITGEHIPAELMDAVRAVFNSEEIEVIDNEDDELGGLSRQKISDMERGRLTISADTAIALSRVFGIPVERFRRRGNLG